VKHLIALLVAFFSTTSFAASFQVISQMKSVSARNLAQTASKVAAQADVFGDASAVRAYSYTTKGGEKLLNTLKQLNFAKGGLNSDDSGAESMQHLSARQLAEHLLAASSQYDDQEAYDRAVAQLTKALQAIKADAQLQIFGTNHADEDGSWQILNILDVSNRQVLFIKIGYHGT
jgi:hypothetical protein